MYGRQWRRMGRKAAWPFVAAEFARRAAEFDHAEHMFDFETQRLSRRRRRMFGTGELRLVLLKLIADEARHGYELIKALEDMTGGAYSPSPGTIYPTLSLLEDEGAVVEAPGAEPRKAYEATKEGLAELEERADEVEAIMARLESHGERRKPFATPEMFRAAGNLAGVLKNKARSGELDEKTMNEIVDLIDELAKKIERL